MHEMKFQSEKSGRPYQPKSAEDVRDDTELLGFCSVKVLFDLLLSQKYEPLSHAIGVSESLMKYRVRSR